MGSSVQLNLPPLPLKRVAVRGDGDLNRVDMPLSDAQALAGQIVRAALAGEPLKAIADKGQVSRWCAGQENPNLAKLIASADRRKAMARALLRSCAGVKLREVFEIEDIA